MIITLWGSIPWEVALIMWEVDLKVVFGDPCPTDAVRRGYLVEIASVGLLRRKTPRNDDFFREASSTSS